MTLSSGLNRRRFFSLGGVAAAGMAGAGLSAAPAAAAKIKPSALKLGLASYSTREFSLDETIAMCKALGLEYIALKSFHLPLEASAEECKAAAKKIADAGLKLMGGGVIRLPNDKAVVRAAFAYAAAAGMPTIIAAPDPAALPFIDKMVREYDIKVAIHNHGPTDKHFPSPLDAYRHAQPFDKRLGVCMDIGHTARNGEDEIAAIYAVKDRLLDFHMKDVDGRKKESKTLEMGRGVVRLPEAVKALAEIGFTGHVAIEYEKDKDAPVPGMHECAGYLRGVAATLALA